MVTKPVFPPIICMIPAAGSGSRMGGKGSKLLLPLGGEPLIARTLKAVASCPYVRDVVLLVPAAERELFNTVLSSVHPALPCSVHVVIGGGTRQDSVVRGIEYIEQSLSHDEKTLIMIHDGARCFATRALFDRSVEAALERGAVTAAQSLVDSIKQVDANGRVVRSLSRQGVWAIQTPQVFRFELLKKAHQNAPAGALDDASLVETHHPVWVIEGERSNIKVTTPEDYSIAQEMV